VSTLRFVGSEGRVTAVETAEVEPQPGGGTPRLCELEGTRQSLEVDLALLALGFDGAEREGLPAELRWDGRGNLVTDESAMTSVPGVFAAGDLRRGQSLVVWAIAEGRRAAREIDRYLMGDTLLPG